MVERGKDSSVAFLPPPRSNFRPRQTAAGVRNPRVQERFHLLFLRSGSKPMIRANRPARAVSVSCSRRVGAAPLRLSRVLRGCQGERGRGGVVGSMLSLDGRGRAGFSQGAAFALGT